MTGDELLDYITEGTDDRIYAIAAAFPAAACDRMPSAKPPTSTCFFLDKIKNIVDCEKRADSEPQAMCEVLQQAKQHGLFRQGDRAALGHGARSRCSRCAAKRGIPPVYKMIDTCATEFESYIPYFYSTYEEENESVVSDTEEDRRARLRPHPHRAGRGVRLLHRPRGQDHPAKRATRPSSSTTTPRRFPPTTPARTSCILSR